MRFQMRISLCHGTCGAPYLYRGTVSCHSCKGLAVPKGLRAHAVRFFAFGEPNHFFRWFHWRFGLRMRTAYPVVLVEQFGHTGRALPVLVVRTSSWVRLALPLDRRAGPPVKSQASSARAARFLSFRTAVHWLPCTETDVMLGIGPTTSFDAKRNT